MHNHAFFQPAPIQYVQAPAVQYVQAPVVEQPEVEIVYTYPNGTPVYRVRESQPVQSSYDAQRALEWEQRQRATRRAAIRKDIEAARAEKAQKEAENRRIEAEKAQNEANLRADESAKKAHRDEVERLRKAAQPYKINFR